ILDTSYASKSSISFHSSFIFLSPFQKPFTECTLCRCAWHTLCQPRNLLVHQGFWNGNLYRLGRRGNAQVHKNAFHLLSVSRGKGSRYPDAVASAELQHCIQVYHGEHSYRNEHVVFTIHCACPST